MSIIQNLSPGINILISNHYMQLISKRHVKFRKAGIRKVWPSRSSLGFILMRQKLGSSKCILRITVFYKKED